ncbi:unnamed protein product [Brassica oleracea var. botrytis]|uniref:(rape) hypothetical protein n=1 Tax=Brassica napus TaxID=3708 RepID=A0A816JTQ0_BRANA|nr:unnamed protein product [Brassica napus]
MANMPGSSKLLAVMLFSFVALFVISQARTFPTGRKLTDYPPKTYGPYPVPVPTQCFYPPYCRP